MNIKYIAVVIFPINEVSSSSSVGVQLGLRLSILLGQSRHGQFPEHLIITKAENILDVTFLGFDWQFCTRLSQYLKMISLSQILQTNQVLVSKNLWGQFQVGLNYFRRPASF